MGTPEVGPLTDAILADDDGGPPAIVREWEDRLEHPGQFVFLWTAATKRASGTLGWLHVHTHFGEEKPEGDVVTQTSAAKVERMLSPLSHEGRVRIMQALYPAPMAASELSDATGFRGGALYHHLKELKYAAYVTDRAGRYELTQLGVQMLLTVTCMASRVIEDRGEEGLVAGGGWREED
ncbi:MAG: winged helix-turn-helix domain-containing protein [Candidatus Brocadiaceae bacterium]|jgi:DNA-binding transcriptional ArsR family regulator